MQRLHDPSAGLLRCTGMQLVRGDPAAQVAHDQGNAMLSQRRDEAQRGLDDKRAVAARGLE